MESKHEIVGNGIEIGGNTLVEVFGSGIQVPVDPMNLLQCDSCQ